MTYLYLDTETTGLNPFLHEIWEIGWAFDDRPVESAVVPHSLVTADPAALQMNRYYEQVHGRPVDTEVDLALKQLLDGVTLVGANPAFDASFLYARWGIAPWKYRLLDIEVYAMPALGLDEPRGLAFLAEQLEVVSPDHTAAGDVATLRAVHQALQMFYKETL